MSRKDAKIQAKVSGGTAQGVIGAGEVHVEHLVINNYAQPSTAAGEKARAEPGELSENPYKGLLHFGPDDHALFYGRDKAIDKIIKAVDERSFNAVLGPSGCGKSSLLLAGVAPRLDATGEWAFTYFRVSDSVENDPFLALAQALLPLYKPDLDETDRLLQRRKLGVALREGEIPFTDIFDAIRGHWPKRRVLLIADQFEELYTSNIESEIQARFMDFLIEAARVSAAGTPPGFSLAVTLRADFLGLASLHRPFADAIDESVHILGPMKPDELRQAVAEPAGQLGVTFEEGLVETILADVGREPGNLPLLEFALTQMWDQQQDHRISLASYDGVGRVTGALTKHADEVFAGLDSDSRLQARRIFTQLVKPGAGTEDTRRMARRDELDAIWPLVQSLAGPENRLVVTNATADEGETAEVVHEALIKHWGMLREWVAQDRAFLTWLDTFRISLKTWTDNERQDDDLVRGAALSQAEEWGAKRGEALNNNEKAFIDASIEYRYRLEKIEKDRQERELHDAQVLARRRAFIANGSVFATIIFALMGWFLYNALSNAELLYDETVNLMHLATAEKQRAEETAVKLAAERDKVLITQSRFLADLSRQMTEEGDVVTGMLLALDALPDKSRPLDRPYVVEAERSLYGALYQRRELWVLGHKGFVYSAAFSPDGTRVVTASDDGTARLWDVKTGAEIDKLLGHRVRVSAAAFSPDGARLVTASDDGTARLWDAKTGAEIDKLVGHLGYVSFAAFSPDGALVVTTSEDNTARLWDVETGGVLAVLEGHVAAVFSAAFSPDGAHVVTASTDYTAGLWDTMTGALIAKLRGHEGMVWSAAFSPDGARVVTASDDGTARLWDAQTGAEIVKFEGHENSVMTATFSPDGTRVVTASMDYTARLWGAETGTEIAVLKGHEDRVRTAAFSPDGARVVTASYDKTARLWDAETGAEITVLVGHQGNVGRAAFSPDSMLVVTASWDNTARLWDAKTGAEITALVGHEAGVNSAVFSPDGARVATASRDGARLWVAETGAEIAMLEGHEVVGLLVMAIGPGSYVRSAAFDPNGARVVTASDDGTARLWDAKTGAWIAELVHEGRVNTAVFSPDSAHVVTASTDRTARLWGAETGTEIAVLKGHENGVMTAAFSPEGMRVVTTSMDYTARLWDAKTGAEIDKLVGHLGYVSFAAFSPDGALVVTTSEDTTARLWDVETGGVLAVLVGHEEGVNSAAFSPDGARVVTASRDKTARLWDAKTGAGVVVLVGHEEGVNSAAFSPDGARVVTASDDGTARLWDAKTGAWIAELVHEGSVNTAVFSPDSAHVVTASTDRTARLWPVFSDTKSLVTYVSNTLPRRLRQDQRERFYLSAE